MFISTGNKHYNACRVQQGMFSPFFSDFFFGLVPTAKQPNTGF